MLIHDTIIFMTNGVNGPGASDGVDRTKKQANQVITPDEIKEAVGSHIADRLGNIANRLVAGAEDKATVLNDLRIFINAWSDPQTDFFFYRDDFAGNAVYPSHPELDATSLGANNQAYIAVKDKASKLDTNVFKQTINIETLKARLGQIKEQIQNDNIDLYQITDIAHKQFAPEKI